MTDPMTFVWMSRSTSTRMFSFERHEGDASNLSAVGRGGDIRLSEGAHSLRRRPAMKREATRASRPSTTSQGPGAPPNAAPDRNPRLGVGVGVSGAPRTPDGQEPRLEGRLM